MSDSLRPHGLQHTTLFYPPLSLRVCSNSCPLRRWCYPTVSSSVARFSCLQFFLAWAFYNKLALSIKWPKYWSFSSSISLLNEYSRLISFRIDYLISLQSKGLSSLLQHHNLKGSVFQSSAFFMVQPSHPHMTAGKTIALSARWCLCFLIHCLDLL